MKWWGNYELSADRWSCWQIGPLCLFAQVRSDEWRVAYRQHADTPESTVRIDIDADAEPDPESYEFSRFAVGNAGTELVLRPRLGDRPFIVSTEQPLYLLAGEKSLLYVSTVVWVQLGVARATDDSLLDLPAIRRSDTWFGANTREGELCYATRSSARTRLDAIQPRPHRAVTPVEVRNHGSGMLPIEQLRVPVPALSLYCDEDDRLWTDTVCFVRREGDRQAAMTTPGPSLHLPGSRERIHSPRAPVATGTIVQAFSKLLT